MESFFIDCCVKLRSVIVDKRENLLVVLLRYCSGHCLSVCNLQFTVMELQALATKTVVDYYDPMQRRYLGH